MPTTETTAPAALARACGPITVADYRRGRALHAHGDALRHARSWRSNGQMSAAWLATARIRRLAAQGRVSFWA